MGWPEIVFGSLLVAVLLLLSCYFGWRQLAALRRLREQNLPGEEAQYERSRARRRLVSCGFLLLLGLLLGGDLLWIDPAAHELAYGQASEAERTAEQKQLIRLWVGTWITLLVLLLVVVGLAAVDLWATRRHAFRKFQADRRWMLQRQAGRLREEGK